MNWFEASQDHYEAAKLLLKHGYYRSSVSRAYYAMYAALTARLVKAGHATFGNRGNPGHEQVITMFKHNIIGSQEPRYGDKALSCVRRVRQARVTADYMPGLTLDRSDALSTLRDCELVCRFSKNG